MGGGWCGGEPGRERERKGGGGKDKPLLLSPVKPNALSHPGKKAKRSALGVTACVMVLLGPSPYAALILPPCWGDMINDHVEASFPITRMES